MPHATLAELQVRGRLVAPMPGRAPVVIPLADLEHLERVTPGEDNVGTGVVIGVSAVDDIDVGTYELRCTSTALHGGTFQLRRPTGEPFGGLTLTPGSGNTTTFTQAGIHFQIRDGAVDFAVGDRFTFTPFPNDAARVAELAAALDAGDPGMPIWLHGGRGPQPSEIPEQPPTPATWVIENPDGLERLAAARLAGVTHVIAWDYAGSVADDIARR